MSGDADNSSHEREADANELCNKTCLFNEANWFHGVRANSTFELLRALMTDICRRLNVIHKVNDPKLAAEPRPKPLTEKFSLQPRTGQESLSAVITLCGEKIVQAEVSLKYAKSASGFYRATAQPEVHWKMQQLQDAGNISVRALHSLLKGHKKYSNCMQKDNGPDEADLRLFLFSVFNGVKADIEKARSALTMPKKKSLVELCNYHPIKSFVPPLPHDILLSFYISSAKLVCAAYQVSVVQYPKQMGGVQQQTVTIYQADAQVAAFVDIVHLLNSAFAVAHEFVSNFGLLISAGQSMSNDSNATD